MCRGIIYNQVCWNTRVPYLSDMNLIANMISAEVSLDKTYKGANLRQPCHGVETNRS